jgi:hypothetical protein
MASVESDYLEKRGQQIARKQKMVTYIHIILPLIFPYLASLVQYYRGV